jgi:hypothetical protein
VSNPAWRRSTRRRRSKLGFDKGWIEILEVLPCGPSDPIENTLVTAPPEPHGPVDTFGDGYYVVGEDIRPGSYRADVPAECYWARYRDFNDGLIENGYADHDRRYVVTIERKDAAFETSRCGTWKRR